MGLWLLLRIPCLFCLGFIPGRCFLLCLCSKYLEKPSKSAAAFGKWHTGEPEVRHPEALFHEALLPWAQSISSASKFKCTQGVFLSQAKSFLPYYLFQLHSVSLTLLLMVFLAWIQGGAQSYWCFLVLRCPEDWQQFWACPWNGILFHPIDHLLAHWNLLLFFLAILINLGLFLVFGGLFGLFLVFLGGRVTKNCLFISFNCKTI